MTEVNRKLLHSVFEAAAARFPQNTAVECQGRTMTYGELQAAAAKIGRTLRACGARRDVIVALMLESGSAYVACVTGVMRSGALFMPLDLGLPQKRLTFLLNRARPAIAIVPAAESARALAVLAEAGLPAGQVSVLTVDAAARLRLLEQGGPDRGDAPDFTPDVAPDDSCYIMYTSGSTGEPKPIEGLHKSLSHFMHWEAGEFGFDQTLRVSQLAPLTFDASLRDIFLPLITGGRVCVPGAEIRRNPAELLKWLEASGVTLVHCVPSLFRALTREIEARGGRTDESLPALTHVLMAGEALYGRDIERWRALVGPRVQLVNLYGASETTLVKTFQQIGELPAAGNAMLPVGQPISNTAVLVVKNKRLCAIGEIGDIYLKTPFRTKGYYRDPELTARSFLPNPLTNDPADIVYRTGDLGRYLPDRSLEFIGRLDNQVKVGGIRIEPGEIERAVLELVALREAVVLAFRTQDQENVLACYFTENEPLEVSRIREHLAAVLPEYMIPGFFIRLPRFPLNINGKIDRRALPRPEEMIYSTLRYDPPEGPEEEGVARIWAEVLRLPKAGVTNHFFEIGGNSLNAIRIISRIARQFGVELSIKKFFENPTVRGQAALIAAAAQWVPAAAMAPLAPGGSYALSAAQRRLWVLDRMEKGIPAYHVTECVELRGDFNLQRFLGAFARLLSRHPSLRTVFTAEDGEPRQRVLPALPLNAKISDLRGEPSSRADELLRRDSRLPFSLEEGPLFRLSIVVLDGGRHLVGLTIHHIVCDGWSMGIMFRELMQQYASRDQALTLPPLALAYHDFAAWQNAYLAGAAGERLRRYWLATLEGELPVLDLPADFPRPALQSFAGATVRSVFPPELTAVLKAFAAAHGASLFMALAALVYTLLYRYTGQEEILLGAPVQGRTHPELEGVVGFFANTLVLRERLRPAEGFTALLKRVAATCLEAYDHQHYPFDRLVSELNIPRRMNRNPLFDVMLILQDSAGDDDAEQGTGLRMTEHPVEQGTSRFDLALNFHEHRGTLILDINYCSDLFLPWRMAALHGHLATLMRAALARPEAHLTDLDILREEERRQVIEEFNNTARAYPADQSIVSLFEAQAARTPEAIALLHNQESLSYRELNGLANRLARGLREQVNLQAGNIAALMVPRSTWHVAGLLAIMKTGAAYLPLDPEDPDARIGQILADSACRVLLTDGPGRDRITGGKGCRPDLQVLLLRETIALREDNLPDGPGPADPAYVIYTSGSTGRPKGVVIPHRGIVNMQLCQIRNFAVTKADRVLQFASPSFDASIYEIFMALLAGGAVVVIDRETIRDPGLFHRYIEQRGVTFLVLPPLYLGTLDKERLRAVRLIVTAGEPAVVDDARYLAAHTNYVNAYGPTEASVCVSLHRVDPDRPYLLGIPIGRPNDNTEVYILDRDLRHPQPLGVSGELCVSGPGLMLGYLHRPDLTDERLVPHPFQPGRRLYRTGDLGRWLPDGEIEFQGRIDEQVKLRGYRIEPGEIEHCLRRTPGVRDAVVVLRRVQERQDLVAYLTASEDLDISTLRETLLRQLPSYMVPAHLVQLDALPLTASGKVNRKLLPAPAEAARPGDAPFAPPANRIQEALIDVWRSVLGLTRIGIHDGFFTLGGDSIKAIQVVGRLGQLGLTLDVKDIFLTPSVAELSLKVRERAPRARRSPVTGRVPLTPIQHFFFAEYRGRDPKDCVQVLVLKAERSDAAALRAALAGLLEHHDSLRMRFVEEENGMIGICDPPAATDPPLEEIDLVAAGGQAPDLMAGDVERWKQGLDLGRGPLYRFALYRTSGGDQLLILLHHLCVDLVSWRIIFEDLDLGYGQALAGRPVELPPQTTSFQEWAAALGRYAGNGDLLKELPYWREREQAIASCGTLPGTKPASDLPRRFGTLSVSLDRDLTRCFLTDAHQAYGTGPLHLLLTALARALSRWRGAGPTVIALEGHGREPFSPEFDLSRTVGWFTSLYPFLLDLPLGADRGRQIKEIKEALNGVPGRGLGYGLLRYLAPHPLPRAARPTLLFNYLGHFGNREQKKGAFETLDVALLNAAAMDYGMTFDLDFTCLVEKEKLEALLLYNEELFSEASVGQLAKAFSEELEAVIAHCTGTGKRELTPSDIDYEGFSIDQLDEILGGLDL